MTIEIKMLLPAIATITAALIAGAISLTNLVLTKETKISEFRQTWIDALRDELAVFFASTRVMTRAVQEMRHVSDTKNTDIAPLQFTPDKITEVRHAVAGAHYKIKLRLNIEQPDHLELLQLLEATIDAVHFYFMDVKADAEDVFAATKKASNQAALVLKDEWRTVKGGEPQYQNAVRSGKIVFSIAAALLVVVTVGIPFFPSSELLGAEQNAVPISTLPPLVTKPSVPTPTAAKTLPSSSY